MIQVQTKQLTIKSIVHLSINFSNPYNLTLLSFNLLMFGDKILNDWHACYIEKKTCLELVSLEDLD